jgi:hypothetical protein
MHNFLSFKTDLDVLRKIPVIPALILSDEDSEDAKTTELSLLQWISSKDNQSDLEKVAEQCFCRLEQVRVFYILITFYYLWKQSRRIVINLICIRATFVE